MFGFDTVIVAIIGAAATIYGIREARAGRRDALVQQAAANKLAQEKQELDTLREVIAATEREVDRAAKARDDARREAEQERARRQGIEQELRAEVDAERSRRIETETALRLTEEQSARAARRFTSDIAALTAIVRDEVSKEAARTAYAIEQAEPPADPTG